MTNGSGEQQPDAGATPPTGDAGSNGSSGGASGGSSPPPSSPMAAAAASATAGAAKAMAGAAGIAAKPLKALVNPVDTEKPLGDHLEELRKVILKSVIALFAAVALCFLLFSDKLIGFCLAPLNMDSIVLGRPPQIPGDLITIKALDRFKLIMVGALLGGVVIAGPYMSLQIWRFVSVGLYEHERKIVYVYLPAASILFLIGAAFGYLIMLPVALDFLLNFGGAELAAIRTDLLISDYLLYFFVMTIFLGLIFEIPLILMIIARVTDVNPGQLRAVRKFVIVGALVVAMIMTPPDPITQVMLALPMVVLYEIGVWLAERAHRQRMIEHRKAMEGPNPWDEILDGEGLPEDDDRGPDGDGGGGGGGGGGEPPASPAPAPAGAEAPTPSPTPTDLPDEPKITSSPGFRPGDTPPAVPGPTPAMASAASTATETREGDGDADGEGDDEPVAIEAPRPVAPWAMPATPEARGEDPALSEDPPDEPGAPGTLDPPDPPAPTDDPAAGSIANPDAPAVAAIDQPVSPFQRNVYADDDGEYRYELTREEITDLIQHEIQAFVFDSLPSLVADEVERRLAAAATNAEASVPTDPDPSADQPADQPHEDEPEPDDAATEDMPADDTPRAPLSPDALRRNLDDVRSRIAAAAMRSGRSASDVTLCAVTKTATIDEMRALIDLGVTDLGENRLHVAQPKIPPLDTTGADLTWHMIGHVQRNKARKLLELFDVFHSIDSLRLAESLSRICVETSRTLPIMLEINSGEDQKDGVTAATASELVGQILELPALELTGLMTMAPFVNDEAVLRRVFANLRELRDRLAAEYGERVDLRHLSMGMTNDYEIAIEEGATIVRVGSALFRQ